MQQFCDSHSSLVCSCPYANLYFGVASWQSFCFYALALSCLFKSVEFAAQRGKVRNDEKGAIKWSVCSHASIHTCLHDFEHTGVAIMRHTPVAPFFLSVGLFCRDLECYLMILQGYQKIENWKVYQKYGTGKQLWFKKFPRCWGFDFFSRSLVATRSTPIAPTVTGLALR